MTPDAIPTDSTVFFFHLQRQPLETALPKLLLKTLKRGWRAAVCMPDSGRLARLSEALWAVPHEWILPHGFGEASYPERHPIWLATDLARPNAAEVVFLCHGIWRHEHVFSADVRRLCLMLEPGDLDATQSARALWQGLQESQRILVKI
ncbi:MAG: DNA polymerase III subunit chi [Alphaproteobacteria bacterium]|nr:DNA polymerase III subunit chi [Alphaproteobacteria bacterium]